MTRSLRSSIDDDERPIIDRSAHNNNHTGNPPYSIWSYSGEHLAITVPAALGEAQHGGLVAWRSTGPSNPFVG